LPQPKIPFSLIQAKIQKFLYKATLLSGKKLESIVEIGIQVCRDKTYYLYLEVMWQEVILLRKTGTDYNSPADIARLGGLFNSLILIIIKEHNDFFYCSFF